MYLWFSDLIKWGGVFFHINFSPLKLFETKQLLCYYYYIYYYYHQQRVFGLGAANAITRKEK